MRRIGTVAVLIALVACGGGNGDAFPSRDTSEPRGADSATVAPGAEPGAGVGAGTGDVDGTRDVAEPAPGGVGTVAPAEGGGTGGGWKTDRSAGGGPATGVAVVSAVRIASHGGYDRLVIEMEGTELPGYVVEFAERPAHHCGSGMPVEIAGARLLRVRLEPANAHTEEGEPTLSARRWTVGLPVIEEVVLTCDFEAQVEILAGLSGDARYRVVELTGPARIVVDVMRE